ncbi:MAG: tetratricopeptide repeat protein [Sphingobium sp.]
MPKKASDSSSFDKTGSLRWGRLLLAGAAILALIAIGWSLTRNGSGDEKGQEQAADEKQARLSPEEAIRLLEEHVATVPNDVDGWKRLGWVYAATGKYGDAVRSYRHATELAPKDAALWSALGEALVMADRTAAMPPEAAAAFDKAVAIDPKDPRARYFKAVQSDLAGDHEDAIESWFALLKDSPPDAPWVKDLRHTIERVGKEHDIPVAKRLAAIPVAENPHGRPPSSAATAAIPGPTLQQMKSGEALPVDQKSAMVSGMVASLEAKLKEDPRNVDRWLMLMRSRMTLGEKDKAAAALAAAIANNPKNEAYIRQQAAILSVPGA